jgi:hypothetical protein
LHSRQRSTAAIRSRSRGTRSRQAGTGSTSSNDLDYCRNEEGYPGLVVHGPLQTILLLDLARRQEPRPVRRLEYRALHPLFHFERFTVNGNPTRDASQAELWTANSAGNYAMAGTASIERVVQRGNPLYRPQHGISFA